MKIHYLLISMIACAGNATICMAAEASQVKTDAAPNGNWLDRSGVQGRQYAIPGETYLDRIRALESLGISRAEITRSINVYGPQAHILGLHAPADEYVMDDFHHFLRSMPRDEYILPGATPEERLAAFKRAGGNENLLSETYKKILGLPNNFK